VSKNARRIVELEASENDATNMSRGVGRMISEMTAWLAVSISFFPNADR
jgi:hypothetical protein